MIHPGGTGVLRATDSAIFPAAAAEVAMSRERGPPRPDGIAIESGLVPSRAARPPNGATAFGERPESAVISPIIPASAAIRVYDASRPMWPWRNTVAAATIE